MRDFMRNMAVLSRLRLWVKRLLEYLWLSGLSSTCVKENNFMISSRCSGKEPVPCSSPWKHRTRESAVNGDCMVYKIVFDFHTLCMARGCFWFKDTISVVISCVVDTINKYVFSCRVSCFHLTFYFGSGSPADFQGFFDFRQLEPPPRKVRGIVKIFSWDLNKWPESWSKIEATTQKE